ncbi:MAG TPA: hypothetical protein VE984_08600 [Gaiellaceae bacterium]|nr:hypothetical protein [Gaiellaceae bacterium]
MDAGQIANHEAPLVQVDDGAAHAVARAEAAVVAATEDLIADAVLALGERDGFAVESTMTEHEGVWAAWLSSSTSARS